MSTPASLPQSMLGDFMLDCWGSVIVQSKDQRSVGHEYKSMNPELGYDQLVKVADATFSEWSEQAREFRPDDPPATSPEGAMYHRYVRKYWYINDRMKKLERAATMIQNGSSGSHDLLASALNPNISQEYMDGLLDTWTKMPTLRQPIAV